MEESILQMLEGLSHQLTTLSEKVDSQGEKITALTEMVNNQWGRISTFSERVSILGDRISIFSGKMDSQVIQHKENTQILKSLEQLAQVNKVEHEKITFDIAEISGEVRALRKDLLNVEIITASNWSDIAKLKSVK